MTHPAMTLLNGLLSAERLTGAVSIGAKIAAGEIFSRVPGVL
jgi:hypothetical protein